MDSEIAIQITDLTSAGWFQNFRLRRWLARRAVFVRTCRLIMQGSTTLTLYRLTYASTCSNYAQAESQAEEYVKRLIQTKQFGRGETLEFQWKRGRMITDRILKSESEQVQQIICRLWSSGRAELLAYETVEDYRPSSSTQMVRESA